MFIEKNHRVIICSQRKSQGNYMFLEKNTGILHELVCIKARDQIKVFSMIFNYNCSDFGIEKYLFLVIAKIYWI